MMFAPTDPTPEYPEYVDPKYWGWNGDGTHGFGNLTAQARKMTFTDYNKLMKEAPHN